MTDTTTRRPKAPWTRCKGSGKGEGNGCRQRIWNDPVDIEYHQQHCPADLERVVDQLTTRIEKLEKAAEASAVTVVAPELPDLDDVADDWPTGDELHALVEGEQPRVDPVAAFFAPVPAEQTPSSDDPDPYGEGLDAEDDGIDDPAPVDTLGALRNLYRPGTGPDVA